MKALVTHMGIPVVLDRTDIDTDQIIPKQFLKKIERVGFGAHLFHDMRFLDAKGTKENPNFELNMPRYRGASILISGRNFGSGSSREHAPWALQEYGFRILIASSFADIFYNNTFKNGILPIILEEKQVNVLKQQVLEHEGEKMLVDVQAQTLQFLDRTISFSLDAFRKSCLLNGWDDIDLTLLQKEKIAAFAVAYKSKYAYLFPPAKAPAKALAKAPAKAIVK